VKCIENQPLFCLGNSDPGFSDAKTEQGAVIALRLFSHFDRNFALLGELLARSHQISKNLSQSSRIAYDRRPRTKIRAAAKKVAG
jgi:hypothetical protein